MVLPPFLSSRIDFKIRRFMRTSSLCRAIVVGFVMVYAIAAAGGAGIQGNGTKISVAETLLFETDHLAHIKPPSILVYEFRKVSNTESGFVDKVQLDVTSSKGKIDASLHFLTGPRNQAIPPLQDAHGNPVLLGFLERDVAEMKRLTGGSADYFRKRIRMVLATGAEVRAQTILYEGKNVQAQAIRIRPYLNDPMHARFEPYVNKTYVFIVSDQVPGGVYQLSTSLGNGVTTASASASSRRHAGADEHPASPVGAVTPVPAIDETLTLVSVMNPQR